MEIPACLLDVNGSLTLELCKPFGLGIADWIKLVGLTLIAVIGWLFRSILKPLIAWPAKAFKLRNNSNNPNWPKYSNERGRTQRDMIGRPGVLERLREILTEGNPAALTNQRAGIAAIHGQGGVGKSFTAHTYVSKYRKDYQIVWIIPADTSESIHDHLGQLAAKVGIERQKDVDPTTASIDLLRTISRGYSPSLIVFDNAISPKDIQPYLVETSSIHYLITSRHDDWKNTARDFPVGVLSGDEALELLKAESDRSDPQLSELVSTLDRLPLALVIAGAYLRTHREVSVGSYSNSLEQRLDDAPVQDDYDKSLYAAVMASYDRLSENAKALANYCSTMDPNNLDIEDIFWTSPNPYPESLGKICGDRSVLSETFAELRNAGLAERIDVESRSIHQMHRLTQAVIRFRLEKAGLLEPWLSARLTALVRMTPIEGRDLPENWPVWGPLIPQIANLDSIFPSTKSSHLLSHLLHAAAAYLSTLGEYSSAQDYSQQSIVRLPDENFPGRSEAYVARLNTLGNIKRGLGDFNASLECFKKAESEARHGLSHDHPLLAAVLANAAGTLFTRSEVGDLEQAVRLIEEGKRNCCARIWSRQSRGDPRQC